MMCVDDYASSEVLQATAESYRIPMVFVQSLVANAFGTIEAYWNCV